MGNYRVESLVNDKKEIWNRNIKKSPMATVYHQYEFLKVIERNTPSKLHLLIGYKGQEEIGLLPLFEISKGPLTTLFSPPPDTGVPFIGPILVNYENLGQYKIENRNKGFLEQSKEYINKKLSSSYTLIRTSPEFSDPRPFQWNGYNITPRYTYYLDITRPSDKIINDFKKSRRRMIQQNMDEDYRIEKGGKEAIRFIYKNIKSRYNAQGKKYNMDLDYFYDLYSDLPSNQFIPYIAIIDDEYASGIIVIKYKNKVLYWQGGGKVDIDLPINDLVHWRIINDSKEEGKEIYDLTGANTPRLCRYKSKFNPDLKNYYIIKDSSRYMSLIEKIYSKYFK